ncbi:DUF202 domain-containing protein [Nocardioides sp. JQ2195]|uniref:DUF202 domain-containing protein n=1 Tax=Nocardioides sp. JQ2195 TaxID=2592334 RepID=UPI00143EE1C2|nr:DUF202 domain-containing protein [Nocardioides sp. JQ2195]QIX25523.1 DUF202 domain-containing protein [Nocardioides sp. JQ2195]
MTAPYAAAGDDGLSNERTALAWQRTALSLAAACAIMARLTWSTLGPVAIVLLSTALVLSAWVFLASWLRYSHDAGTRRRPGPRGGRAPLALAVATALIATTELAAVAFR